MIFWDSSLYSLLLLPRYNRPQPTKEIQMKSKNKAIYTYINDRKTFIGKHVGDALIRDFSFHSAVMWKDKELGFDIRLLTYAKNEKIKRFIFQDHAKQISLEIGIRKLMNNGSLANNGQGTQWYIPKSIMKKINPIRTPYVKNEVTI